MSRPLRCTERCCDRCPAENSVVGKYFPARSISVAAGLGFPKQRLGPRRRNAKRVATSLTRRSNLSVTFADRIGNAQRGIGPLHLTEMFPGSAPPLKNGSRANRKLPRPWVPDQAATAVVTPV